MKRIILFLLVNCLSAMVFAQFTVVDANAVGVAQANIDTVLVLDDVAQAKLIFQDSVSRTYSWYSYALQAEDETLLLTQQDVMQTQIPLLDEASMGYHLVAENMPDKWVWVFNYKAMPLALNNLTVHDNLQDRCVSYQLELDWDATAMEYDTLQHNKVPFEVERTIYLTYDSTYYAEGGYLTQMVTDSIPLATDIVVPSPLDVTTYTIEGDQFAKAFGNVQSIESEAVTAYAVETNLEASVRIREYAINEGDKDISTDKKLSGSAPLNIEIINTASPAAFFYDWCLSGDKEFNSCQLRSSQTDFRYTFENQGTYYLRVQTTNSSTSSLPTENCMSEAVYTIEVINSMLEIPNVFTPNGDGINDEFKVSYKSLVSFSAKVYNAWGRLVYSWTDPAQGWDGTIGGNPAAEGTYFYYIEAVGADKDEKGNPISYVYKGDINLLR
jgi:gliding motility-associated-like protein